MMHCLLRPNSWLEATSKQRNDTIFFSLRIQPPHTIFHTDDVNLPRIQASFLNNQVSQSCTVGKSGIIWRATGQSNLANRMKNCSIGQGAVMWVWKPNFGRFCCGQPFVCQVWLSSGLPEYSTSTYCTWLWNCLLSPQEKSLRFEPKNFMLMTSIYPEFRHRFRMATLLHYSVHHELTVGVFKLHFVWRTISQFQKSFLNNPGSCICRLYFVGHKNCGHIKPVCPGKLTSHREIRIPHCDWFCFYS